MKKMNHNGLKLRDMLQYGQCRCFSIVDFSRLLGYFNADSVLPWTVTIFQFMIMIRNRKSLKLIREKQRTVIKVLRLATRLPPLFLLITNNLSWSRFSVHTINSQKYSCMGLGEL
jgi:hypothetical protein